MSRNRASSSARTGREPSTPAAAGDLDCVIVGAGPAGLQLGYWLRSAGRRFVILEQGERVGSFFERYPRSRSLISFNKIATIHDDPEINLRWDWNSLLTSRGVYPFREFSTGLYPAADAMLDYLGAFAKAFDLPIRHGARVSRVDADGAGGFRVEVADGSAYRSRYVVVATGVGLPNVPSIPGIEAAEGYEDMALDPGRFAGQTVLIVGKGNSALEVADRLIESAALVHMASPTPVQLALRTRHPGHLRTNHARLLDLYQLKMLHSVLDCTIQRIEPCDGRYRVDVTYVHADDERDTLLYDRLIRCTGFRFDDSWLDGGCRPEMVPSGRFPAMTESWESTNVPGMYFIGTLMQVRDFRKAGSAFIDGFRYNIRTLHRLLEERYHGRPYPRQQLEATASVLADHLARRATLTSALWVQFKHLCDVVVVDADRRTATVHQELPVDCVAGRFRDAEHVLTLHFEWGSWEGDVFAIERHPSHAQANLSMFLHPVVRSFRGGELQAEHHLLEDLIGVYHPDYARAVVQSHSGVESRRYHELQHVAPLRRFLASVGIG